MERVRPMTDVVAMAEELYHKVNQQRTPEQVGFESLVRWITDAIRDLYVISGRTFSFSEDKFRKDETGVVAEFADDLALDERRWV